MPTTDGEGFDLEEIESLLLHYRSVDATNLLEFYSDLVLFRYLRNRQFAKAVYYYLYFGDDFPSVATFRMLSRKERYVRNETGDLDLKASHGEEPDFLKRRLIVRDFIVCDVIANKLPKVLADTLAGDYYRKMEGGNESENIPALIRQLSIPDVVKESIWNNVPLAQSSKDQPKLQLICSLMNDLRQKEAELIKIKREQSKASASFATVSNSSRFKTPKEMIEAADQQDFRLKDHEFGHCRLSFVFKEEDISSAWREAHEDWPQKKAINASHTADDGADLDIANSDRERKRLGQPSDAQYDHPILLKTHQVQMSPEGGSSTDPSLVEDIIVAESNDKVYYETKKRQPIRNVTSTSAVRESPSEAFASHWMDTRASETWPIQDEGYSRPSQDLRHIREPPGNKLVSATQISRDNKLGPKQPFDTLLPLKMQRSLSDKGIERAGNGTVRSGLDNSDISIWQPPLDSNGYVAAVHVTTSSSEGEMKNSTPKKKHREEIYQGADKLSNARDAIQGKEVEKQMGRFQCQADDLLREKDHRPYDFPSDIILSGAKKTSRALDASYPASEQERSTELKLFSAGGHHDGSSPPPYEHKSSAIASVEHVADKEKKLDGGSFPVITDAFNAHFRFYSEDGDEEEEFHDARARSFSFDYEDALKYTNHAPVSVSQGKPSKQVSTKSEDSLAESMEDDLHWPLLDEYHTDIKGLLSFEMKKTAHKGLQSHRDQERLATPIKNSTRARDQGESGTDRQSQGEVSDHAEPASPPSTVIQRSSKKIPLLNHKLMMRLRDSPRPNYKQRKIDEEFIPFPSSPGKNSSYGVQRKGHVSTSAAKAKDDMKRQALQRDQNPIVLLDRMPSSSPLRSALSPVSLPVTAIKRHSRRHSSKHASSPSIPYTMSDYSPRKRTLNEDALLDAPFHVQSSPIKRSRSTYALRNRPAKSPRFLSFKFNAEQSDDKKGR